MKDDHRFPHLVGKHELKESVYDPDKYGHLNFADVIKRNPQNRVPGREQDGLRRQIRTNQIGVIIFLTIF